MQSGFQELLDEFLLEARERTDNVESMLLGLATSDRGERGDALAVAKRELHTLKGNSGMMGFTELQQLAHQMEDQLELLDLEQPQIEALLALLDALRGGLEGVRRLSIFGPEEGGAGEISQVVGAADQRVEAAEMVHAGVRVPFSRIDHLVDMQAETLISRNRLADAIGRGLELIKGSNGDLGGRRDRFVAAWEEVELAQQALEKTLHQLQDLVTNLGMVPLRSLFRSLQRIVHDESRRDGKQAELVTEGGETPIDKALLETASEALGHLVRNAVTHGIEAPEARRKRGKRALGRIRLSASVEGGEVRIEVADDGGGVDLERLRSRAREVEGGVGGAAGFALLFEEGLSTREDADLSAGRGVGLTAVKRSVERHGGRIDVSSQRGEGTLFTLRLPVTASILRSLVLEVDSEQYALPLAAVVESLRPDAREQHEVNRAGTLRWRGRLVPLLDIGLAFGTAKEPRTDGFVTLIDINGRFRGLVVDAIAGIRDIVVKSLDAIVGQPTGISGSTILGDGRVIMILDPVGLASIPPFVDPRG